MSNQQSMSVSDLSKTVEELVRRFGSWATLKAAVLGAMKHQQRRNHATHLSDRLRRDAGLPVREPIPGQPLVPPWFPRF